MSNTDGPAALRRLAEDYEFTLNSEETPIATFDDVNVIKTAADTWDSERNQAAADRAALELARALAEEWIAGDGETYGAKLLAQAGRRLEAALGGAR